MKKIMVLLLVLLFSAMIVAGDDKDSKTVSTNETLKVIKSRRSIRAFKDEQVKEADLQAIIEAGLYAPSGMNKQTWHITVIQDKKILDKMTDMFIAQAKKSGKGPAAKNPKFRIFYGAPTGIVVSAEDNMQYAPVDCAAAQENMLIAAESLGLGAGWEQMNMVLFEGDQGKELIKELGIPNGYTPIYTFALGYKDEQPQPQPRRENSVNYVR